MAGGRPIAKDVVVVRGLHQHSRWSGLESALPSKRRSDHSQVFYELAYEETSSPRYQTMGSEATGAHPILSLFVGSQTIVTVKSFGEVVVFEMTRPKPQPVVK